MYPTLDACTQCQSTDLTQVAANDMANIAKDVHAQQSRAPDSHDHDDISAITAASRKNSCLHCLNTIVR